MTTPKIGKASPVLLMTPAEVYFLRAEAAMRGWVAGGTAEDLYNNGIKESFKQWGVKVDPTVYIDDATSVPANFEDQSEARSTYDIQALSTITIKWDESCGDEQKLERIITQKWIAMFPEGQEAWSEFRRTGYPKIFPVVKNNSSGTINTEKQICRNVFPVTEYANNNKEVQNAIEMLGGPDTGGTSLWWDKK